MAERPFQGAQLWATVKGFAGGPLSFREAWSVVRQSYGVGVGEKLPPGSRERFGEVWAAGTALAASRRELAAAPPGHVPTVNTLVDAPVNYGRTYAYTVQVTGRDIHSGQPSSAHYIMLSDSLLDVDTAAADLLGRIGAAPELYDLDPEDAEVVQVERSAGVTRALLFGTTQAGLEDVF